MNRKQSNFKNDLNGEKVLAEFLDEFFYPRLNIINFYRNVNNMNEQYKGIDLTFEYNGKKYIIDEKATLQYPNGIPTFAFEIAYKKDDKWKTGWFYYDKKETEYYLFAWPIRENVRLSDINKKHIHNVEVMLIERKKMMNYLYSNYQIDKQKALEEAKDIKNLDKSGRLHIIHEEATEYYYYTGNLKETPINIIINKDILKRHAEFHFNVCRNYTYPLDDNSRKWLKSTSLRK